MTKALILTAFGFVVVCVVVTVVQNVVTTALASVHL